MLSLFFNISSNVKQFFETPCIVIKNRFVKIYKSFLSTYSSAMVINNFVKSAETICYNGILHEG